MNLSFYIARRYLFSKKSQNAINIISLISVCGVMIATTAMVCALSVFNGFDNLVATMFSSLDPEIKIMPAEGKVFDPSAPEFEELRKMPEIEEISEILQDYALVSSQGRQDIAIIKGVDQNYDRMTGMKDILVDGRFALREDVVNYATMGIGIAYKLGVRVGFVSPLEIYAPKRDERVNMSNPASSFGTEYAYLAGIFSISQAMYDDSYIIVPIELTRSLFRYENEVSALELKLVPSANTEQVQKNIRELVGDAYVVQNRYEQQANAFKMMQVEKAMTFLILSFILTIALFNLVGSLSMLMNEKKEDIRTLQTMGANADLIKKIFLFEGWMISAFGAVIGIVLGIVLCFLQIRFGLIQLGQTAGAFVIDAYPVHVIFSDIVLILVTVLTIGFLSSWYPVRFLSRKWLKNN